MYTWKQPWQSVAAAARHDLPAFKLVEHRRKKKQGRGATWMSQATYGGGIEGFSADVVLEVVPGRCRMFKKSGPTRDNDSAWVTVSVISALDDNWITVLRCSFFAQND